MGRALSKHLAGVSHAAPVMWCSPSPRAVQTAAIIAEHLSIPFFDIRQDWRLREINVGEWVGRSYDDVIADHGEIVDPELRVFRLPIPGGEDYKDVEARLKGWLTDAGTGPAIVVSHGLTTRILRGLLADGVVYEGVKVAPAVTQGSVVQVAQGEEQLLWRKEGR